MGLPPPWVSVLLTAGDAPTTPRATSSVVKTPGGKLAMQYIQKKGKGPKCGDCGTKLIGIPGLRPKEYHSISRRQKPITRAYGGSRCGSCVRQRIIRAFLVEEQKIVKAVIQASTKAAKK